MSIGTFNAQQQSDVHAYWEFNRGTNWVFPHYELPFTGGLPGTFPGLQYRLQSVIPGSGPFGVVNTAATHGDDPDNPRDPDRFEPVSSGQTETRIRFIPSGLTAEIFERVHATASFLPASRTLASGCCAPTRSRWPGSIRMVTAHSHSRRQTWRGSRMGCRTHGSTSHRDPSTDSS